MIIKSTRAENKKKMMNDENKISFKYFELCDETCEKLFTREIAAEIAEKLSAFGIRRLETIFVFFFIHPGGNVFHG